MPRTQDTLIRLGRPDEYRTILETTGEAFGSGAEFFATEFAHTYPGPASARWCITAWRGGKLVGVINQAPMRLRVGGVKLSTAGIGGVCALPECRGQGIMSRMLLAGREHLRQTGTVLGVLSGKRVRYRRHGFEQCGVRVTADVTEEMLAADRPLAMRKVKPSDAASVARLSRKTSSSVWRTRRWQELLIARPGFQAFCNRGKRLRAYFVFRNRAPGHIVETAGEAGLIRGMLKRYMSDLDGPLTASLLPGGAFDRWAAEQGKTLAGKSTQLCIYDFGRLLTALAGPLAERFRRFGIDRPVTLCHTDEGCGFELRPGASGLVVSPASGSEKADLALDAPGWARTFFPPPEARVLATPTADPRLTAALAFDLNYPPWDGV